MSELSNNYNLENNTEDNKEDTRNFKGFSYEILTALPQMTKIPGIQYQHNPNNYYDWLSENQKNKHDGIVTLPNGETITLEFKRRDCQKVYHSWFMDCWYPRESDWIVTNNVECISYNDRVLLESKGVRLFSLSEALVEIGRLVRNILHPRKYLYFNRLISNIINNILELTSSISRRISNFNLKVRLKDSCFKKLAFVKSRFSKSHLIENRKDTVKKHHLGISQFFCLYYRLVHKTSSKFVYLVFSRGYVVGWFVLIMVCSSYVVVGGFH